MAMPTQLSTDACNAAVAMDDALYQLKQSSVPSKDAIAAALEEALDSLTWEPRDIRDLRYALRKFGYDAHTIMLPGQESIEYELQPAEYAAIYSNLMDIANNDGLLLVVEMNQHSVDPSGIPYVRVSVSREVSA